VSGPLLGVHTGGGGSAGESGPLIRINMPLRILRPGEDGGMPTI
jgi:hypothetical protein